jgi:heme/copper-type cytochrome/quinol oxidase subunit 2
MAFEIRSVAVIQTISVSAARLDEDATRGITTGFREIPDRLGIYPITGPQLCGSRDLTIRTPPRFGTAGSVSAWLAERCYTGGRAGRLRSAATHSATRATANVSDPNGTVFTPLKKATTDAEQWA